MKNIKLLYRCKLLLNILIILSIISAVIFLTLNILPIFKRYINYVIISMFFMALWVFLKTVVENFFKKMLCKHIINQITEVFRQCNIMTFKVSCRMKEEYKVVCFYLKLCQIDKEVYSKCYDVIYDCIESFRPYVNKYITIKIDYLNSN